MKRLRLTAGDALTAVGVLHTTYGLSKHRQTLGEIARWSGRRGGGRL